MMLCCLTIQVSSCLFDKCCGKKTAIKEKILVNTKYINKEKTELGIPEYQTTVMSDTMKEDKIKKQIKLSEPTEIKKKFIHDGQSDLTEDQKQIVYAALSPMVKQFCRAQSTTVITRLIAAFLWHRNLPEQRIGTVPGDKRVRMCQLSSDDSWLVSLSGTGDITLWNLATNQIQWTVKAHDQTIFQCILSSNDKYIISASSDKTLKIWTFFSGTLLYTLKGHTDYVRRCSLSADNQFVLSTSANNDRTVRMWSVTTGECIHIFHGHSTEAGCIQFYANDRRMISTCKDVRLWDVQTKDCLYVLHGHTGVIGHCTFSSDEQYLLSRSRDRTVRVWDLTTGTCKQTFDGHKSWVYEGYFVRKDTWIASIDYEHNLCIWRISDAHCMYQLPNYHWFFSLRHSYWLKRRNTECIIVSTNANPYEVHVLSVESGDKIFTIQSHNTRVDKGCVSSDGRYLFSGNADGTIKMAAFAKK